MSRRREKREERGEGESSSDFRVYSITKLANSQNKLMHRMKLSWRRKKGSITSGKRDREDGGGTMCTEEAKSWGKRE